MPEGTWLLFLFFLMGAGGWIVEHGAQKRRLFNGLSVRVPRPLAWLCGNPRGDGTVDLDSAVRQTSSLAFLVVAPAVWLLPLDLSRRAAFVFLAYALISAPGFVLGQWVRWRSGRRLAGELEAGRQPGLIRR
jgi:hypothetical protein